MFSLGFWSSAAFVWQLLADPLCSLSVQFPRYFSSPPLFLSPQSPVYHLGFTSHWCFYSFCMFLVFLTIKLCVRNHPCLFHSHSSLVWKQEKELIEQYYSCPLWASVSPSFDEQDRDIRRSLSGPRYKLNPWFCPNVAPMWGKTVAMSDLTACSTFRLCDVWPLVSRCFLQGSAGFLDSFLHLINYYFFHMECFCVAKFLCVISTVKPSVLELLPDRIPVMDHSG